MNKRKGIMSFYVILFCLVFFTTANQVRADTTEQTQKHLIQWGDTISQLAIDYETPMELIVEENKISNPDLIYAGHYLEIINEYSYLNNNIDLNQSSNSNTLVDAESDLVNKDRKSSKIDKLQETDGSKATDETTTIKLNNVVRINPFNTFY